MINDFGGSVPHLKKVCIRNAGFFKWGEHHINLSVSASLHAGTAGRHASKQAASKRATERSDGRRKKGGGRAMAKTIAQRAIPLSPSSAFCAF